MDGICTWFRASLVVGLLALCAVSLRASGAQQPPPSPPSQPPQPSSQPPAPQQPTFRAGINFVRVDVIVTDRQGKAVTDLRQADFEVVEDGKAQTVESFKLIRVTGTPEPGAEPARPIRTDFDEESEASRDDVRLFAIFLDDYHVRRGASMGVREPLVRFLTTQLGPSDMVGLMYPLTPVSDVRMTRNHESVARAIQRFDGRKYDYVPRNEFEEKYSMYPAAVVERIRNQVTMSALKSLVTHLGSLREGRKALILVSEGFTNILPPQLRDPVAGLPGFGNPARGNPSAGQGDPREETAAFFASSDLHSELRDVYDAANRNNTAIYALDPRGLAVFEFDINEAVGMRTDQQMLQSTMDTLRLLADQTDGRAIVNQNDLEKGLRQVVSDSSVYYLIGYSSTQAPSDGRFHEIKVRVKRQGLQVRARKGYWALTAVETARALAPPTRGPGAAVEAALASITEPARGRLIRTWIGFAPGESGLKEKTRVTFVWEPVPAVSGVAREEPVRVSLIAGAADGSAFFRGRVPDVAVASADPASAGAAAAGGTMSRSPSRVTFEANPGRMELRLSIEGKGGQVLDTDMRDVQVPDLTRPQVRLTTPAVFRARTPREWQTLAADRDVVPVAGREFRRTDRLLIRFGVHGPGTAQPAATGRLLNRAGKPMSDLQITAAAGGGLQIDLPLAGLANGEYLIEIKAKVADQADEATELIGFRVVS